MSLIPPNVSEFNLFRFTFQTFKLFCQPSLVYIALSLQYGCIFKANIELVFLFCLEENMSLGSLVKNKYDQVRRYAHSKFNFVCYTVLLLAILKYQNASLDTHIGQYCPTAAMKGLYEEAKRSRVKISTFPREYSCVIHPFSW